MKSLVQLVIVALILGIAVGCSKKQEELPPINIEQTEAPTFEFNDITGNPISSATLKGKWVVINIFATWAPASIKEIPEFIELQKTMQEDGVQFFGLSIDERGIDDARPYAQRVGINYPIACVGLESIKAIFGTLDSIPTTIIISPDWYYMNKHNGLVGGKTIKIEIQSFKAAYEQELKNKATGTAAKPKL